MICGASGPPRQHQEPSGDAREISDSHQREPVDENSDKAIQLFPAMRNAGICQALRASLESCAPLTFSPHRPSAAPYRYGAAEGIGQQLPTRAAQCVQQMQRSVARPPAYRGPEGPRAHTHGVAGALVAGGRLPAGGADLPARLLPAPVPAKRQTLSSPAGLASEPAPTPPPEAVRALLPPPSEIGARKSTVQVLHAPDGWVVFDTAPAHEMGDGSFGTCFRGHLVPEDGKPQPVCVKVVAGKDELSFPEARRVALRAFLVAKKYDPALTLALLQSAEAWYLVMRLASGTVEAAYMSVRINLRPVRPLRMATALGLPQDMPSKDMRVLAQSNAVLARQEAIVKLQQLLTGPMDQFEQLAMAAVLGVCETLAPMHRDGIAHRDIKRENLLLLDGRIKLADFDLACYGDDFSNEGHMNERYNAPEVFFEHYRVRGDGARMEGTKTDIYSLGVALLGLFYASVPLPTSAGKDKASVEAYRAAYEHYRRDPDAKPTPLALADPDSADARAYLAFGRMHHCLPRHIRHMVLKMLAWDPTDRPTAAALLSYMQANHVTVSVPEALMTLAPLGPAPPLSAGSYNPTPCRAARFSSEALEAACRPESVRIRLGAHAAQARDPELGPPSNGPRGPERAPNSRPRQTSYSPTPPPRAPSSVGSESNPSRADSSASASPDRAPGRLAHDVPPGRSVDAAAAAAVAALRRDNDRLLNVVADLRAQNSALLKSEAAARADCDWMARALEAQTVEAPSGQLRKKKLGTSPESFKVPGNASRTLQ